ncbi:MAG: alpha/beta hydrolase [Candidatus Thorarchaeota archaeon]
MPLIDTGSVRTFYTDDGTGSPLVFIHGAGASHDMWYPQISYFSETHRVLTYDLRGHGQSSGSDERYTCTLYARDLQALLNGLDVRRPVLCGISFGGMIAQEYAVTYGGLSGLALVDTAASSALTLTEKIQKAMAPPWLIRMMIKRMSMEAYADWSLKYVDVRSDIREYLKRLQMDMDRREVIKLIEAIYSFKLVPLDRIDIPTLIIVGERDRRAVHRHARFMSEKIRDSKLVVIPQAGHVPNLESPDVFNQHLKEFLAEREL